MIHAVGGDPIAVALELVVRLDDTTVPVVALDDLIKMKKVAARDIDRVDIRALTRSDDELARESGEST